MDVLRKDMNVFLDGDVFRQVAAKLHRAGGGSRMCFIGLNRRVNNVSVSSGISSPLPLISGRRSPLCLPHTST